MTTRSIPVRAWCARTWQWVLEALEAMAGLDPAGPFGGCVPPHPSVLPGWVSYTQWADEPCAVLGVTRHVVKERLPVFAPAEQAPVRVVRDRCVTNRPPFTAHELAHLRFVRWLHQTGRVML
jgi:hypothetical protein